MNFFVIEGTFNNPIPVDKVTLDKALKDHLNYIRKGFDEGWILVSGSKIHAVGGIAFMKANSLDEVENYLSTDPLKVLNITEYSVVEFKPHECQPIVKEWFNID